MSTELGSEREEYPPIVSSGELLRWQYGDLREHNKVLIVYL
jgi:hypothetical protein